MDAIPRQLSDFIKRTHAIADPRLHRSVVERFLDESSPDEAVEALRLLMADVDRPGYRQAYRAVVDFFVLRGRVGYRDMGQLYRAAHSAGYAPVRFLLLRAPPMLVAAPDEVLPDPKLAEVSLGRRKTMARSPERDLLLRLVNDTAVSVVEMLLQNPKLLEADVVRLAARRPSTVPVLEVIARHPRWNHRYSVQHALIQNPYCPTVIAVSFVPFLVGRHLTEVANDARLHEAVRSSSADVRSWRAMRRKGPSKSEGGTRH